MQDDHTSTKCPQLRVYAHTGFLIIKKFRNYQYGLGTVLALCP